MVRVTRLIFCFVFLFSLLSVPAFADAVTRWNNVALDLVRKNSTNPPKAARALAMMHIAMFDAVNAIDGKFQGYALHVKTDQNIVRPVAASVAAHRVLVALFPQNVPELDTYLGNEIKKYADDSRKQGAIALGLESALAILEARRGDLEAANAGSSDYIHLDWSALLDGDIGRWVPTPPNYASPLLPSWGKLRPFGLISGNQFRLSGPPAYGSTEQRKAVDEIRALGAKNSPVRSSEETQIALFWSDGAATCTPPGHFNLVAQEISQERGLGLYENARLFALLNMALADAGIAAWDMKFTYWWWRPITELHHDIRYKDWEPLIDTPPFPEYVSGHSTFSGAASAVLINYFGTDEVRFTVGSDGLKDIQRTFSRISDAAKEAGRSRIFGGIHYEFSNQDGQRAGGLVGNYVFKTQLQPL